MLANRGKYELWYVESINRFQTGDGDILMGTHDIFNPFDVLAFKHNRVSDILEDKEGNIVKVWFVPDGANDADDILYDGDRPPSIFTTWDDWRSQNIRRYIYE